MTTSKIDESFFDLPVDIRTDLDRNIADVFKLYDVYNNNMIEDINVGIILRTLGCVPSESEIQEIIDKTEFKELKGIIHLARFLKHLKVLLSQNKFHPLTHEELHDVFKILDPKNRGYIPQNEFLKCMQEIGESLSENELNDMLDTAVDPITKRVYYEKYLKQLTFEEDDDSVYKFVRLSLKK